MNDPRLSLALRMGDNALILAQQNSKWCGHAPTLEEDIALANIALDLIGQARYWLDLAGNLEGKGRNEDQLAFFRDAHEFCNACLVEERNGDYARTLMRQYLFDLWHLKRIEGLVQSSDPEISAIASKARNEVKYHRHRSRNYVLRLGAGSEESIQRMQIALDALWPAFGSLFEDISEDADLKNKEVAAVPSSLKTPLLEELKTDLNQTMLILPQSTYFHKGAAQGIHSENLGHILSDMQFLQRAYPGLEW